MTRKVAGSVEKRRKLLTEDEKRSQKYLVQHFSLCLPNNF